MADLGKMTVRFTAESEEFERGLEASRGQAVQFAGEIEKTGISITDFKSALDLAGQAVQAIGGFFEATIGESIDYAMSVDDLSRALGVTAQEASTLIQVSDDLRISQGTLETAMRTALRQGITPNMEGLIALSEEYQALPTDTERAQFALDTFGRSGLEMQRILELDEAQLRSMADEVSQTALVIDQDYIQAADDVRLAMDAWEDSIDAVKYKLAGDLMPVIAAYADGVADGIERQKQAADSSEEWAAATETLDRALRMASLVGGGSYWAAANDIELQQRSLATTFGKSTEAVDGQAAAVGEMAAAYEGFVRGPGTMVNMTLQEEAEELAALKAEMSDLQLFVSGPLGREMESFAEQQGDLEEKMGDVRAEMERLQGLGYDEQSQEIIDLQAEYVDLQTQVEENATAHEDATARILFGIAQQKLALSDLTYEEQLTALEEMAGQLGIVDSSTESATVAMNALIDATTSDNAGNLGEAMAYIAQQAADGSVSAQELQTALEILDGTAVTIDVNYNESGLTVKPEGWQPIAMATGGAFWASQATPLIVGEGGEPEWVTVTPMSKMGGDGERGMGGVGDTINVTINDRLAGALWMDEVRRRQVERINGRM